MEEYKFYKFKEMNEWEGEDWVFYVPMTVSEYERVKAAVAGLEETYKLYPKEYDEHKVNELTKHPKDGYMLSDNKCSGVNLPETIDMDNDDPFYKGQCWIIDENWRKNVEVEEMEDEGEDY